MTPVALNSGRTTGVKLWSRAVIPTILGLIVLGAVYAHIRLLGEKNYVGILSPLDRLFDLVLATSIALLLICIGSAIARLFKLAFSGTAETICFSLFLGTGVFGLTVLGLGLLGLLRLIPVCAITALAVILCRRELPGMYVLVNNSLKRFLATTNGRILFALFAGFTLLLVLRTATPPHVFDENIYHLPVTSEFVRQGRVVPCFNNSMGNQPFLIHMIYAVCLLTGSDIAAKFFSLIIALGTALSLYAFSRRFFSARTGFFAAFGFFAAGMVTEVAVTTRVDVSVAGMLFVATYAMINYLKTSERGWFWASSLLAGFSLGIKHSAALWIFLIGVMYVIESLMKRQYDVIVILSRGIAYTMITIAIASPWYVKNYVWFGNPFYPFFTGEVADFGPSGVRYFNEDDEQKLDSHFRIVSAQAPTLVEEEEQALSASAEDRPERHPMRPWEWYLRPNIYLMAEARHLPNYLFLVVPLSLIVARNRLVLWLLALSSCYFLMATWSSWIARYLLPVYPALSIVMAYTLVHAGDWLKERLPSTRNIPVYSLAAALVVVVVTCISSLNETRSLQYVIGRLSRQDFMLSFPYYRPVEFINRELPANAHILSIGAQMMYGIQRAYESDETWYTTKWRRLLVRTDSLEQVNDELKKQGIDYVVYSPGLFLFAARMGLENGQAVPPKPGPLASFLMHRQIQPKNSVQTFEAARRLGSDYPLLRNWATFSLYRNKFLETVYSDDEGFRVYRIR